MLDDQVSPNRRELPSAPSHSRFGPPYAVIIFYNLSIRPSEKVVFREGCPPSGARQQTMAMLCCFGNRRGCLELNGWSTTRRPRLINPTLICNRLTPTVVSKTREAMRVADSKDQLHAKLELAGAS